MKENKTLTKACDSTHSLRPTGRLSRLDRLGRVGRPGTWRRGPVPTFPITSLIEDFRCPPVAAPLHYNNSGEDYATRVQMAKVRSSVQVDQSFDLQTQRPDHPISTTSVPKVLNVFRMDGVHLGSIKAGYNCLCLLIPNGAQMDRLTYVDVPTRHLPLLPF